MHRSIRPDGRDAVSRASDEAVSIMRDPKPIGDEVRSVRDAIAKEYDYDIAFARAIVRKGLPFHHISSEADES